MAQVTKRQWRKSIYLDTVSHQAFLFLKSQPAPDGFRFSTPALFRQFLAELRKKPKSMLRTSGWKRRGDIHGHRLVIPLAFPVKDQLDWLERYYAENAPVRRRVRDGVPKARRLPISLLFSRYIKNRAAARGWIGADQGLASNT